MQQTDIMKTKVTKVYINFRYDSLFCVFGICVCSVCIMYAYHHLTNDIIPMNKKIYKIIHEQKQMLIFHVLFYLLFIFYAYN
jgi:hypothetical protein